ncbi:unnamed protein product [Clonostachys byssicola]|uniref:Uncharacterized protein n=1 Tax=Clonostachys byssicola TaxID=160290 RepID=A0A9N9XVC6_9HYPO|nr:unnamed protein product [Clonostachys byssicola]
MDSKQHQSSSSNTHKTPSKNGTSLDRKRAIYAHYFVDILESTQPHRQPRRTFKLYEFHHAFGCDAHHFIFIEREPNSEALATFEENLGANIGVGHDYIHPFSRIFTETDLKNIQASCLEILAGFEFTADHVTYRVILGPIEVKSCGEEEGHIWFDETFTDKYPHWDTGFNIDSSQILDLEKDMFV